jgi:hypothetical protein
MDSLLKRGSKGEFVSLLQEMLCHVLYPISIDGRFGPETEKSVLEFQRLHQLKQDGMAGTKTWALLSDLFSKKNGLKTLQPAAFLKESDFEAFATQFDLEPAVVKAVHEVESNGRGFSNGKIKLLFEGHIFWKELLRRGIAPATLVDGNENILYKNYFSPNKYYRENQHQRLQKALKINAEAAYGSASYGLFQIMGFHAESLGFANNQAFYDFLSSGEAAQLEVFGRFLLKNKLLDLLRKKQWASFARKYNGPAYQTNKYDLKLEKAYLKYKSL